jgi:hypothetical protein
VTLGILCQPAPARGSEPRVDFVGCSSISPAVTTELLAIELNTLGITLTPAMRWTVRCHEQQATVQLHGTPALSQQVPPETASGLPNVSDVTASANVDLSSTDEAAWPRLIAISASELLEQVKRGTSMGTPAVANQTPETLVRVQLVDLAAKAKKSAQYLPSLGLSLGHQGDPGTNLFGASLGVDRRLGSVGLLAMDLRSQWGKTSLSEVNVTWQLTSLALAGGAALDLGAVNVDVMAGARVGRIALSGEATTSDLSGRRLVGATAGPIVALRLRRSLGRRLFLGLAWEEGYGLLPVRGNYDDGAPLLTVKGLWSNATFSVGWGL